MSDKPIQQYYPNDAAQCYGCGYLNNEGLHIESFWDGDQTVCRFRPRPYHTAVPGYVYGGLIASLIDCHGTGSAALAAYRAQKREPGSDPPLRFLTASLQVDYLEPTPLDVELEARGTISEVKGRKVVTDIAVYADDRVTARGRVIAVQAPDDFMERLKKRGRQESRDTRSRS
jgi:acyl-coenzyme A thioesterase PaaI-like protein